MSRILDVSNKLGQYILKGYTLTDEPCPSCSIPLLRKPAHPDDGVLWCCQCSDIPQVPNHNGAPSDDSVDKNDSSTKPFEPGTPFSPQLFDHPEILHRRAQSDKASIEIGNRMLKGWAMLAEECPNESCYCIPLMRPPKSGAEKDRRKECVICGSVYTQEKAADGRIILKKRTQALTAAITAGVSKEDVKMSHQVSSGPTVSITDGISAAGQHASANATSSLVSTLGTTIISLQNGLEALSTRLASVASIYPPDHIFIGELAHSIEQVSSALRVVNTFHTQQKT